MNDYLIQAYLESRYYRQLHHTLTSVISTSYLALLWLQFSLPAEHFKSAGKMVYALVIVPAVVVIVLVLFYHKRIAYLNGFIAHHSRSAFEQANDDANVQRRLKTVRNGLVFEKYEKIIRDGYCWARVGKGHCFMIAIIAGLCAANVFALWFAH